MHSNTFQLYLLTETAVHHEHDNQNRVLKAIHNFLILLLRIERRLEPWFRPQWDYLFREPGSRLIQFLINRRRKNKDSDLELAEERFDPDEEESLNKIIDLMMDQMRGRFKPGGYERGVIPKHTVSCVPPLLSDDLPEHCRKGILPIRAVIRHISAIPTGPECAC